MHLIAEVSSIKDSFQQRSDELNESIYGLKKDTQGILNRVPNTEKHIGAVEDQMAADCKTLKDLNQLGSSQQEE